MRIVVNDIAASSGGAMTILKQFYEYIKNNDSENEWIFLLGDNFFEETENIKIQTFPEVKRSNIRKICFDFVYGKNIIGKLNPDIVFSLQNIITFGLKRPQIVYVHQSLPYQTEKRFSFLKKEERVSAFYQKLVGRIIDMSMRKADKVIVQTEWMRNAVVNKIKIAEEKIVSIMPDYEIPLGNINDVKQIHNRFFYPTSDNVYKNNEVIRKACECLNKEGIVDFEVILTLPIDTIKHNNITCVGYMQKEEVFQEYVRSTLVFPSYIETVGMPLMEARCVNGMILASKCPFSYEVLNGYENGYYFDPFNPEELARLMKKIILMEIIKTESKIEHGNNSKWEEVKNCICETKI